MLLYPMGAIIQAIAQPCKLRRGHQHKSRQMLNDLVPPACLAPFGESLLPESQLPSYRRNSFALATSAETRYR
jgi:hypothetical protein